jgi:hypothetical protein
VDADAVIAVCIRRGIDLSVSDGRLRYRAPHGAMTERLSAAVAGHRDAIIARLEAAPVSRNDVPDIPDGPDAIRDTFGSQSPAPDSLQIAGMDDGCGDRSCQSSLTIPDNPDIPEKGLALALDPSTHTGSGRDEVRAARVPVYSPYDQGRRDIRDINLTSKRQITSSHTPIRDIPDAIRDMRGEPAVAGFLKSDERGAPLPWRAEVAGWSIPARQLWADRAEEHQVAGLAWPEAERRAFDEVCGGPIRMTTRGIDR